MVCELEKEIKEILSKEPCTKVVLIKELIERKYKKSTIYNNLNRLMGEKKYSNITPKIMVINCVLHCGLGNINNEKLNLLLINIKKKEHENILKNSALSLMKMADHTKIPDNNIVNLAKDLYLYLNSSDYSSVYYELVYTLKCITFQSKGEIRQALLKVVSSSTNKDILFNLLANATLDHKIRNEILSICSIASLYDVSEIIFKIIKEHSDDSYNPLRSSICGTLKELIESNNSILMSLMNLLKDENENTQRRANELYQQMQI